MANEFTVLVTGNTYPVRDELRALGGVWLAAEKAWRVPADKADEAKSIVARGPLPPKPYELRLDGEAIWAHGLNSKGLGYRSSGSRVSREEADRMVAAGEADWAVKS